MALHFFFIVWQMRTFLFYHFVTPSRTARNGKLHGKLATGCLLIKDKFYMKAKCQGRYSILQYYL